MVTKKHDTDMNFYYNYADVNSSIQYGQKKNKNAKDVLSSMKSSNIFK